VNGWRNLPHVTRDVQKLFDYPQQLIIRLNTADISEIGRNTQGVRLIHLEEGDHLVSVARLAERDDVEDLNLPAPPPDGPPEPAKEEE
jgi:DNA gyrase subunit A